jgi:hypothetical protein
MGSRPDKHGNVLAQEGCSRCACGCKYWENDVCIDCKYVYDPKDYDAEGNRIGLDRTTDNPLSAVPPPPSRETTQDFKLQDLGPAQDTPKRRGSRTIYVDGPNGKGDQCSHIEVSGPDRDAFTSVLLALFGAKEVMVETDEEHDARIVAKMLEFSRGRG